MTSFLTFRLISTIFTSNDDIFLLKSSILAAFCLFPNINKFYDFFYVLPLFLHVFWKVGLRIDPEIASSRTRERPDKTHPKNLFKNVKKIAKIEFLDLNSLAYTRTRVFTLVLVLL